MKAGWKVKLISEFAQTGAGGTPTKGTSEYYEGGTIPWLLSGEVANANITEATKFITDKGLAASSAKLFPKGSVLVAMYGATAGEVGILRFEASTNQAICAIKPNKDYVTEYLYYYLLKAKALLVSQATGGAQPNISQAKIKSLQIPLPPLEEQKRIVSILDEAFEGLDRARENAEANLKSARELFESSLGAVFDHASDGWTRGTVGSMVHNGILKRPLDGNHGETHPKKSEFQSSGVPFIMASDLENGSVDQNNCYFISKSQAETLRKGFAKDGDVLISHKGTIGRTAVLRTDLDYVMLTPQVTYYRIADQNRLLPEYLYFYFHSATFLRVMRDLASAGSTRAYIGITKQHELPLLFPETTLQLELIDRFKSIEAIRNKAILSYETKLQDISDLRQSLLQKAFAGELT